MNRFFTAVSLLFKKDGINNYLRAINFGINGGIKDFLENRTKFITAEEFLQIIEAGKNEDLLPIARERFMESSAGIAHVDAKSKITILQQISGKEALSLFDEKYFGCTGKSPVEQLDSVFDAATDNQKKWLAELIMLFFSKEENKKYWTVDRNYMFEHVTSILINAIGLYEDSLSKEFLEFLIDEYGMDQAFERGSNDGFIRIMDLATQDGITRFFENNKFDMVSLGRLALIEQALYETDRASLITMVNAMGCFNPFVEGYLICTGEIPCGAIHKNFCHPTNFERLVELKGADNIAVYFPEALKEKMPSLWGWLKSYNNPVIAREACSTEEWRFVLANDYLRNIYLAKGGMLTGSDATYLGQIGKFEAVADYRGKKAK